MNLSQIAARLNADQECRSSLEASLGAMDRDVMDGTLNALYVTFREMTRIDHAGQHAVADKLEAACFDMASVLLQHVDECGLSTAICRGSRHLHDFSFIDNLPSLMFDHMILVEKMGVPESKVRSFWHMADQRRQHSLHRMSQEGFKFRPLLDRRRKTAAEVADWAHLLRPFVLLGGVALIGANAGLALGTIGLSAPLTFASVGAGSLGVLDGAFDD